MSQYTWAKLSEIIKDGELDEHFHLQDHGSDKKWSKVLDKSGDDPETEVKDQDEPKD